jgi:hypothetical protein
MFKNLKTTTMGNTNTFSILFCFWTGQKSMKDGQALFYARITVVDGKRVNLNLK